MNKKILILVILSIILGIVIYFQRVSIPEVKHVFQHCGFERIKTIHGIVKKPYCLNFNNYNEYKKFIGL
jgi:hypothetical protein